MTFPSFTMPGCAYAITRYYRRREITTRIAFFMLMSAAFAQGEFERLVASMGTADLPKRSLRRSTRVGPLLCRAHVPWAGLAQPLHCRGKFGFFPEIIGSHRKLTGEGFCRFQGIITIGVGLTMFLWFPADPSKTRIFNEAERKLSVERFFADQPAITEHKEGISWSLIKKALKNPVMLTCVWLYTCNNIVRHCSPRL